LAEKGGVILISKPRLKNGKKISVHIPPGIQTGTKLLLKKQGLKELQTDMPGDLYLEVKISAKSRA
jgi:DnaJ-class molecular chaperone